MGPAGRSTCGSRRAITPTPARRSSTSTATSTTRTPRGPVTSCRSSSRCRRSTRCSSCPRRRSLQKTPINYPDLSELLRIVEDKTGVPRGAALTVAIGHSGAFRTLQSWLDEPLLDQLVMVDAMYGDEEQITSWYRASPRHRLILVGEDTMPRHRVGRAEAPRCADPRSGPADLRSVARGGAGARGSSTCARSSCTCRS